MHDLIEKDIKTRETLKLSPAVIDHQRIYPVDYLVIHHSQGGEYVNEAELTIQDAFDSVGWIRGYKGKKYNKSHHSHPQRDKETYAMAQFALHKFTLDGNPYGWRLVPLMSAWWDNVAGHTWIRMINQRSIGIEVCGSYLKSLLDEKALQLIVDYFRSHYIKLASYKIFGHKEIDATDCPGRIMEQLPILKKMFDET